MNTNTDRFVTVLRRQDGLFAVLVRQTCAFRISLHPANRRKNLTLHDLQHFYQFAAVPLNQIPALLYPDKQRLVDAAARLQHSRGDCAPISDVQLILEHTQLGSEDFAKCDNSAYASISSRSRINAFLFRLFGSEIGHPFQEHAEPPETFRIFIRPHLAGQPDRIVHDYLAAFWNLTLRKDHGLAAAISRMASFHDHEKTLRWIRVIQAQLPNRRNAFAAVLMETGAFARDPSEIDFSMFDHLPTIVSRKNYVMRVYFLMRSIVKKIPSRFVHDQLRLAPREVALLDPCAVPAFPMRQVQRICAHIIVSKSYYRSIPVQLWYSCGMLPGLADILKRINFLDANPEVATRCLLLFVDFALWRTHKKRVWPFLRQQVARIWSDVNDLPEDQRVPYLEHLDSLIEDTTDKTFSDHFPEMLDLLKKLCGTGMRGFRGLSWTVSECTPLLHPLSAAFLRAPEASWRQLEKVCAEGDLYVTEIGLRILLKEQKILTIKAFHHFPATLFRIATALGALPEGRGVQIVSEFSRHPMMQKRFGKMSDADVIRYFCDRKELVNPVPRKFREFAGVAGALSAQRRRRYRKVLYTDLNMTRLLLLEQIMNTQMKVPVQAAEPVRHGLKILAGTRTNKRAATRFMRAYMAGDRDYILRHSNTQKWIHKHDFLDLSLWLKGIYRTEETQEWGRITLALEQNPLEAWKLGTYAQSCLAAGGVNQQYAAAVVLDINKRVLYARDRAGRVVGRQLLAISEEGKLVCFSVYPKKFKALLGRIFRDYDVTFARALRLPIHRDPDEPYTIAKILSRSWYDDDAWNPKAITIS